MTGRVLRGHRAFGRTKRAKGNLRKSGYARLSAIVSEGTFRQIKRLAIVHDRSLSREACALIERAIGGSL